MSGNPVYDKPTFCPLACGETLTIQKISGPCKEYIKNTRGSSRDKFDWDASYGILCQSCGYATVIVPMKSKD